MSSAETVSALAEVITALSTAGAVAVAGIGLKTWKTELKGRAEFETARELARATYAVREALNAYRSPAWFPGEYPAGDTKSATAHAHLFQNRWAPVIDAKKRFDAAVLEAEALWGTNVKALAASMRMCLIKAAAATRLFLDDKQVDGETFKSNTELGNKVWADLAGMPDDESNSLSLEIKQAVAAVEHYVKPHLVRHDVRK